jgi:hypothetical protein
LSRQKIGIFERDSSPYATAVGMGGEERPVLGEDYNVPKGTYGTTKIVKMVNLLLQNSRVYYIFLKKCAKKDRF